MKSKPINQEKKILLSDFNLLKSEAANLIKWKLLILFFSICIINSSFSQNSSPFTPKVNNIPTSPEAAMLGRFGDIPVGHYTGTAEISIPIYIIKEAGVEIPITLNYHSSGIKVTDQATWVGLGWDLSPGGAIIQEVRGIRDAFDNNLNCSPAEYTNFKTRLNNAGSVGSFKSFDQLGRAFYDFTGCPTVCIDEVHCVPPQEFPAPEPPNSEPVILVGSLLLGNGNPDIYHYNFGGYSGKFYINPETDQVVLIDKKEEITFVLNGENSISATTLDGTKYYFDIVEIGYEDGILDPHTSQKSGRTFKLSSIQFNNGRLINFSYENAQLSGITYSQSSVLNTSAFAPYPALSDPAVFSITKSDVKVLTKITTSDAIIDFNLEAREDINLFGTDNIKRLKSIDITSAVTNQKIKSFEFGYSYFPYNLIGAPTSSFVTSHLDALGKRLKLDFLREVGYDDNGVAITLKPPYSFEYDLSNSMPLKVSFAKDFWGYYNGAPNTILLPELNYFDYPNVYKANTNNIPFQYNYTGANRYTNNAYAEAGMLRKIKYPTGGFSEFEYEPNSFTNQFIPDKTKLDLLYKNNHLEDQNLPLNIVGKTFQLANATTITFDNAILDGFIPNMTTGYTYAQMSSSYIEFLKVNMTNGTPVVTLIKRWDLSTVLQADFDANHGKQWHEEIRVEYDSNPNIFYTVNVSLPNDLPNNSFGSVTVRSHFYYYDNTGVDVTTSNQCGMRIKSIKGYTDVGNLTSNKSFQYFDGKLLNHFEPIKLRYVWGFKCTEQGLGFCQCPTSLESGSAVAEITISSDLIKEGGNLIGYGRVEETDLANNSLDNTGKKTFEFFNFENLSSTWFPAVINLKNGLPTKESIHNKTGNLLFEKTSNYQDLNGAINCFYGFQIVQNFVGNYDPNESGTGLPNSRSKYSYNATPILSEFNKLQSIQTKQYANGNFLTASETYTYNSQGKIKTVTATNSNGEQLITKQYYPNDGIINDDETTFGMTFAGMTGIPVYTEQYNGTTLLSSQKTVYRATPFSVNGTSVMMPKYMYASTGNNPLEKKVTFDQYDSKGNILQYTLENGNPASFIWGHNQTLPLAKLENATYSQAIAAYTTDDNVFRGSLPNAFITTYTYKPLIGVSTITDPKGYKLSYEYDTYSRLQLIRDHENKIIKKICYNYADQPETCLPPQTFYNIVKSQAFTRNNCTAGGTGSTVTYTVAANAYSSLISQADADQKAQNDVNTNGQNFANTNGTCTFSSVAKSGVFTRNNCSAGTVAGVVTYTVAANTYSSLISQADADQKAQNDVNTNGQNFANTNGTCTFLSVAKSGVFTRNNCAVGGTGSNVTYTVAAGAYTSTINQADADQKAQNDVNANGQNFANTNGTCTFSSAAKSGTFTRNNCPAGQTGSVVTYTVAAGTYSSTISQANADQLAQNDVNTNGQSFANTQGVCRQTVNIDFEIVLTSIYEDEFMYYEMWDVTMRFYDQNFVSLELNADLNIKYKITSPFGNEFFIITAPANTSDYYLGNFQGAYFDAFSNYSLQFFIVETWW